MIERRSIPSPELRAEGLTLRGVAMPYNEVAVATFGPERFEPGAFGEGRASDVILNLQHQRVVPIARTGAGLELVDGPDALCMVANLPDTTAARDGVELVKAGVLRGLSIEFHALEERLENGVRVISKALLSAIGVVDSPAYELATVEARRRGGGVSIGRLRGSIPKGKGPLGCGCHRGECSKVKFGPKAFDKVLRDSKREVLAVRGEYRDVLASRRRGTLSLDDGDDALAVNMDLPDTSAGRDLLALAGAVPLVIRPFFDQEASEFEEVDGVATYSALALRALIVGPVDGDGSEGWPEAEVDEGERAAPQPKRRRQLWQ